MERDLGFSDSVTGLGLGIFFISDPGWNLRSDSRGTLEGAWDDLHDHDRVGHDDRAHRSGAHPGPSLCGPAGIGRGGRLAFSQVRS